MTTVAMLGIGLVSPASARLPIDDAAVLRGDGAFEMTHLRPDGPWLLDAHLDRLAVSAARLCLPLPARADLAALVAQASEAWWRTEAGSAGEGAVRLVVTRGPEHGPGPGTAFATAGLVPEGNLAVRRDGVRLFAASLGMTADFRPAAPWLLPGTKSLSYAVNLAAVRWARTLGGDDVLWTSSDGLALEASTSSLIWRAADRLCSVPPAPTGILAGTTAAFLLDHADRVGLRACWEMVEPARLHDADGVWLASAVRGVVEVRALDGAPVAVDADTTAALRTLSGFPTSHLITVVPR